MNTLQNINLMKNKIILFLMISFALTSCKNEIEPKQAPAEKDVDDKKKKKGSSALSAHYQKVSHQLSS